MIIPELIVQRGFQTLPRLWQHYYIPQQAIGFVKNYHADVRCVRFNERRTN